MKTKKQVNPALIKMMVGYYGTIEAARTAYKTERSKAREFNSDITNRLRYGGQVLFVEMSGRITLVASSDVLYSGSPDALFVLPC